MKNVADIRVSERIADNLVTRRSADELFDFVQAAEKKTVILDFRNVKFASRSFAHEYSLRKNDTDKIVKEKNMPAIIKKMFSIVSKQKDSTSYSASNSSFTSIPLSAKNL